MKIQWLLYNQLNKAYIYDDVDSCLVLHASWTIKTWTSAGVLSLNIYSKLIAYAWGKSFMHSLGNWTWEQAKTWKQWLLEHAQKNNIHHIVVMDSCESYVSKRLHTIKKFLHKNSITLEIRPNQQFIIDTKSFQDKFDKPPVMETFYRWMRKSKNILMEWDKPVWWKRNFDKENRKFDRSFVDVPHKTFEENTFWNEACEYYKNDITQRWKTPVRYMPINREEAISLLNYFIQHHLDRFWELEDAMYTTSDFVYHSLLSIPINFSLLTPQEVIDSVEHAETAINNKEWFIRQVLWWREYMYHWFTFYKEDIYKQNFFGFEKDLPKWFWWPEKDSCKMNCVQSVVEKVDTLWYSHHIERLMIIWNFCLLVWYNPWSVNKWFREQYADAFERVVTPNVLGMSQYADWWNLATKPYVASANYVNKMSNFCKTCYYDPKEKYWEKACPLNYLYRNFIEKNKEVFIKWRQSFILNHLKKIDMDKISQQSKDFIASLENEKDN